MITFEWIIEKENDLTDKARFILGDNYYLSLDLLKLLQSKIFFDKKNHICYYFEAQILKDFHLAVLNCIRRHTLETHYLLRHALESFVLFAYSLVHKEDEEYKIIKYEGQIVDFDYNILSNKAYAYFEKEYPDKSRIVEGYKNVINTYYSHANVFTTRYNVNYIDNSIKVQIFDNYVDDYTRDILGMINHIICLVLESYYEWNEKFDAFKLTENFYVELENCLSRQEKLNRDMQERRSKKENINFPGVISIVEKLNEKYNKVP